MTFSVLGWISELLPGLLYTSASSQAVSRHICIAFDSERSLRCHRHSV